MARRTLTALTVIAGTLLASPLAAHAAGSAWK